MAQQNTQNSQGQLGSLLGAGFGGLFQAPKGNPYIRAGQQGFDAGAGNPGGVGPLSLNSQMARYNWRV